MKSTGHQWYWRYEIPFLNAEFDSYITPTNELNSGDHRLLEVDNRAVVPCGIRVKVVTTSADVLHAWALPSVGVKIDAVPGRLNSIRMTCNKPGSFYGQCREICGANHSFMPIVVEVTRLFDSLI